MADNPSALFDASLKESNYASIAATVRSVQPRALTADQFEDVITIIEWMQGECLRQHDANEVTKAALDQRERGLQARERELRIRMRAVNAVTLPAKKGLARYFGR